MAYLCLALSMALVGSYVALSKPLAALFPVLLLAWLRFGVGAVAMAGWLRPSPGDRPLDRRTRWLLFLESFFGNFLFTVCMVSGVSMTSAVTAGVTMSAIPVAVAVLSWVLLREQIAARTWVAVALAVGGIAAYVAAQPPAMGEGADAPSGYSWAGQLLLLGAVVCEAAYSVIGKLLTDSLSPKRISAIINLWGFALSTPFGLYLAWQFDFAQVGAGMWGLLLFYALAACVWTVWLWMTGLRAVPAARAGVMTVMLPISAAAVGVLVLGERISGWQMLALGVALLSVVVATWPERSTSKPAVASTTA